MNDELRYEINNKKQQQVNAYRMSYTKYSIDARSLKYKRLCFMNFRED